MELLIAIIIDVAIMLAVWKLTAPKPKKLKRPSANPDIDFLLSVDDDQW